jgi:uncharacterized repeat protein (TIGR02059 family)
LTISGAIYYVSPSGSDSNPGTIGQPFFTLNKSWSVVSAGDIIYMRGGTYRYGTSGTVLSGKSGTSSNYITIENYPGETPIINYDNVTFTSQCHGIYMDGVSYIHLKGFRVTSINQPHSGSIGQYGLLMDGSGAQHCIIEQMEFDHIGGWGVVIGANNSDILFLNCDNHHNSDRYSTADPWGWSDGFEGMSHGTTASTNITFVGCRSFWNCDDGWDLRQAAGLYTLDHCWSFMNGRQPGERITDPDIDTKGGDGEGYKFGSSFGDMTTDIKRILVNSFSYNNACGVEMVGESGGIGRGVIGAQIYNNTFYHDKIGSDIQPAGGYIGNVYLYNNIFIGVGGVYGFEVFPAYEYQSIPHKGNNIFNVNGFYNQGTPDLATTCSTSDFTSLDPTSLTAARQSDGSLPNLSFLHLAAGSKLIDAGVDVGLPYTGKAPDLGAFEAQSGSTPAVPAYTSSAVANATPSILEMTYNLTLANIVPAVSAFSVLVNSAARSVSAVVISGTKVQLTLASAIKYGDIVTVVYTKPATSPLQTTAGGLAVSISTAQSVVNNVINSTKEGTPVTITMTVKPNHVHKIINALLTYSATPTTANSPEIISISDLSGNLFLEKQLVTGVTSVKIPINLSSGIYIVAMSSGGQQMASQRMIVY